MRTSTPLSSQSNSSRLLFAMCGLAASASTAFSDNWDNSAGNALWATANNWADNTVPTINDFALFPNTIPGGQSIITCPTNTFALSLNFLNSYTLIGGNIQLGNGTISGGGWNPIIRSHLTGTGPFTFSGGGTISVLPISSNSYTGGTIISGSSTTVVVTTNTALGFSSAPITLNGGRLRLDGSVNPTFIMLRDITLGTGGGTIDLINNAFLDLNQPFAATGNSLTVTGTGTAEFNSTSTRTGTTTVNGPLVRLNNAQALGSGTINVFNTGVLELANGHTYTIPIGVGGGATLRGGTGTSTCNSSCNVFGASVTLNGGPASTDTLNLGSNGASVWNNGTATTIAQGTVRLLSANNYVGSWTITGGELEVAHPSALGSGTSPVVVEANGLLSLNIPTLARDVTLNRRLNGIELLQHTTFTGHINCPNFGPHLVVLPFVGDYDVTFTGGGAGFSTVNAVAVGNGGGRSISLLNGAQVTSGTVFDYDSPSGPGSIIVNGTGSNWDCNDYFQIGHYSSGSLAVSAGGTVSAQTFFAGANIEAGDVVSATITGLGSSLSCANTLWVGYASFAIGGVASFSVLDGAVVTSGAGIVGYGATDTTATISGTGSTWSVQNLLEVGAHIGADASLNIADAGQLFCGELSIGNGASSTASCTISGLLSKLDCGSGGVRMSQGGAASTLHLRGGIVDIRGNVLDEGPGLSTFLLDDATLDMHNFAIGSGASLIDDLQFRSGTLRNVAQINNGAGLTKIWPGWLTLNTSNSYTGPTNINEGTLFVANLTGSATGPGMVSVAAGATLAGPGIIGGLVSNDGAVAPEGLIGNPIGTLTVNGTYSQFATGILRIDIASAASSDRLVVDGPAAVAAGTLDVRLLNGFTPAQGDSFTILTSSSISGQFPTTDLPTLSSGLEWQIEYLPNSVRLVVVSTCAADFNTDGSSDFFDYLDFVDAFSANDPAADFNADGEINFFDYLDFVDAYSAGC